MPRTSTHVLHDVEAVAFAGNQVIDCRTSIGTDGVSVRAPAAASTDGVVRVHWHLGRAQEVTSV